VSDLVHTERRGRILIVEMRRADKRNAVNRPMAVAIDRALGWLDDDPQLWVGVITGSASIFSAGSDVSAAGDYTTERGGEYGVIRRDRRKPLIAAVEGPALGGGMEIVLACDLVVASTTARFGLPEVSIGVVPTCAGLFRAPQTLPLNLARELILTGAPMDADRAFQAGFVNAVTDPGRAVETAVELGERICQNAPLSVQACLASVNGLVRRNDEHGWRATSEAIERLRGTHDAEEGVRAFLEKRRPTWTGR
jgi:enoyl-CoA hydratase/carnithine racemase